ncbi:MAG: SurA N-terminal domain-containing protein [Oligoflexia bacterium]|nr:SurA N-terminal domain-containing protein [Oligoflexia bacterium]
MIRLFHRYKRGLGAGLIVCAVCFVMTGFGLDALRKVRDGSGRGEYAIKVGETLITHHDFYEQKRAIQDNYRRMLGEMYSKMEDVLLKRLNDDLADKLVADAVLENFARGHELFVGENEVQNVLFSQMFKDRFSPEMYRGYLREIGMTAHQFESKIEADAVREQLTGMLADFSPASLREARASFIADETTYTVQQLALAEDNFLTQVADPSESELQALYEEHAAELEEPARASYDYVVFSPQDFSAAVQVQPEDVELYFTDNQSKFMNPPEAKLRQIQFTYPKKADPKAMVDTREKAQAVLDRIKAGEDFNLLAQQNSDDFASATQGGALGWVRKGTRGEAFDDAAFKLKDGETSGLVAVDYGFLILKAEEHHDAQPKELAEVRAEIEAKLRNDEAPAYASAKGHETFDAWQKSKLPLPEFAQQNGLALKSTPGLLGAKDAPAPELVGLTEEILNFPDERQQIVELKDKTIVIALKDYREQQPPPLAEAKTRLTDIFKRNKARRLAQDKAEELKRGFAENKYADLDAAAKAMNLKIEETKEFKAANRPAGALSDDKVRSYVFAQNAPGAKPDRVFEADGKYYLVQVKAVTRPDPNAFAARQKEFRERAAAELNQAVRDSLVEKLKAQTEIDIEPSILGGA